MRANTLAAAEVVGPLNSRFVVAWSNLLPELYGAADPNSDAPAAYNTERVARLPEGAGGGNIRIYFCRPDGAVVHQVIGYWRPERFLEELAFAERLMELDSKQVRGEQGRRLRELEAVAERELVLVPDNVTANDPTARSAAQQALRRRSADELQALLGQDVEMLLRERRIKVYTEGAVGCDS
jgi:hypothetical protein